jgi:hypothetical protein
MFREEPGRCVQAKVAEEERAEYAHTLLFLDFVFSQNAFPSKPERPFEISVPLGMQSPTVPIYIPVKSIRCVKSMFSRLFIGSKRRNLRSRSIILGKS